ncbi:unnamed protein product [Miscanthus lutarioriparius]|uniref:Mitochondrial carrier protein n=1 Tax=Miscanthus lutarioriparius TaxID=422564 RepID=A0A811N212_9POAL|nr:unnamed protein product [Miscanthus lutarioriparius]
MSPLRSAALSSRWCLLPQASKERHRSRGKVFHSPCRGEVRPVLVPDRAEMNAHSHSHPDWKRAAAIHPEQANPVETNEALGFHFVPISPFSQSYLDKTKLYVVGAGMFSGVTVALYPVSVVKTRMQVASGDAMRRNALATFKNILKMDGVPGLYRGFATVIIGAVPTRIIFLTALETTKAASLKLVEPFKLSEPVQAAFANGLAGLSASTCSQAIFVPIDVISQKLMVQGYSGHARYKGGIDVARKVIKADGIRGLYRGFGLSVMTYAPSSAVWWASYGSSQRIIWSALGRLHDKEEAPSQLKLVGVQASGGFLPVMDNENKPKAGEVVKRLIAEDGWKERLCVKVEEV